MNQGTEKYIHFMKVGYDLDISIYDRSFLEKSIKNRMNATSCKTDEEYLSYLSTIPGEPAGLLYQLGNSYSEFFRNPLTFAYLEQVILPVILEKKKIRKEKEIRIWSAACASGQEAYSLAILCDEMMDNTATGVNCRIFATDSNTDELTRAKCGEYQVASLGKVPLKRLITYFTRQNETYTIIPRLRNYIDFSVFDLLTEKVGCPAASIYGNFDLVICSNLLFYYEPESQKRILEKADHCLSSGGYLITGESEREIAKENGFREVFANAAIFQRK